MSTTELPQDTQGPAVAGPVQRTVRPLLERLREAEADYTLTYGNGDLYGEAADHIECLKTVMVAAAEEISRHWAAHCDSEGYGPANLMRRLEEGISAQYGYTAGAFESLKANNERLRAALHLLLHDVLMNDITEECETKEARMGDVVEMNSEGFFASLVGLEADEALARCKVRADEWRDDIAHLQEKLGQTPRADKQGAHAIKQAIMRTQSKLKRLKPVVASYRSTLEKRETHSLWVEAVRAVCGHDALHEVYDWMAAEKKRRAQTARDAQHA